MSNVGDKDKMADIVKELWEDKTGSKLSDLKRNPKDYLKNKGVVLDERKDVQVVVETPGSYYLWIPNKPDGVDPADFKTEAAKTLSASREMF